MFCPIEYTTPKLNDDVDVFLCDMLTRPRWGSPPPVIAHSYSSRSFSWMIASLVWCAIGSLSGAVDAHPFHLQREDLRAQDPFRQLEEILPTPDERRTASGAPGPQYWQQQVDYDIDVRIDDTRQRIEGEAQIEYHNHAPHPLSYLWLQLDQNRFRHDSLNQRSQTIKGMKKVYFGGTRYKEAINRGKGHEIRWVRDAQGSLLPYTVVDTMMRVDLPKPIPSGGRFTFSISWAYQVMKHEEVWGRSGYEDLKPLKALEDARSVKTSEAPSTSKAPSLQSSPPPSPPAQAPTSAQVTPPPALSPTPSAGTPSPKGPQSEEGKERAPPQRRIYEIAQWFPRLAAYTDVTGWQNKPFLGNGEFTLEFGDYTVRITAPDTHTVAATGVLQNPDEVLTSAQRLRLKRALTARRPLWITLPKEAKEWSLISPQGEKTWVFEAKNVRDFAFASSNAFIWDAWGYATEGRKVMAMSYYPHEGEPLWSRYSTQAIVHTLEVYERFTFPYPYPVAISVNGPVGGMEYPMICFNGPRPEEDGTYSKRTKYGLISVIIHEVGHFFFPMIVNSDERQWTWMDEGVNSFLQFQAERAWEANYPYWVGEPKMIVNYMRSKDKVPIMTNSESLLQFGNNAYGKPAAALSILRESVMGPELFDHAFRTYSQRWRFKRPMPADLFRTLEDASGVDLDWFWRGWFYSTLPVDISIDAVTRYRLKTLDPEIDKVAERRERDRKRERLTLAQERDVGRERRTDRFPELIDFYNSYEPLDITEADRKKYKKSIKALKPWQREELTSTDLYYEVIFKNIGGLVSHLPLLLTYEDGAQEERRLPAETWRKSPEEIKVLLRLKAPLKSIEVDPQQETGDINRKNNYFPRRIEREVFEMKVYREKKPNPMQLHKKAQEEALKGGGAKKTATPSVAPTSTVKTPNKKKAQPSTPTPKDVKKIRSNSTPKTEESAPSLEGGTEGQSTPKRASQGEVKRSPSTPLLSPPSNKPLPSNK